MSSNSSEINVLRTRVADYREDDGTAPYAYEPKPCQFINLEGVLPETSCRERPYTVGDVLTHCQMIHDSIQTLDKLFNVIRGKVLKLHRLHVKSMWRNHKAVCFSYRSFRYLFSRRLRYQGARKKHGRGGFPARAGGRRSLLVRGQRSEGNKEASPVETSAPTQGSLMEAQQEKPRGPQDPLMLAPCAALSLPTCFISQKRLEGEGPSSKPSFLSAQPCGSRHPSARVPAAFPEKVLRLEEQPLRSHPELMLTASPALLALKSRTQCTTGSSLCTLLSEAGSSAGDHDGFAKLSCSDPATWSVDDVTLFLKQSFAENLGPLADLFREHDIDGEALLLLTIDIMMKYMDLKLETALKVYGHIERLKEKKYLNN
ncbi:sex comb on midleg-like protein 1 [Sorex fumeus]|uniref:sex comb on midleg-like protein 1 n=1 Tax=Sorex fumeus TaxID=62283 RepID=UPI0024ACD942|nr:sex comb on midleg-like protein 1 [Sorex fumeus]